MARRKKPAAAATKSRIKAELRDETNSDSSSDGLERNKTVNWKLLGSANDSPKSSAKVESDDESLPEVKRGAESSRKSGSQRARSVAGSNKRARDDTDSDESSRNKKPRVDLAQNTARAGAALQEAQVVESVVPSDVNREAQQNNAAMWFMTDEELGAMTELQRMRLVEKKLQFLYEAEAIRQTMETMPNDIPVVEKRALATKEVRDKHDLLVGRKVRVKEENLMGI